MATRYFKHKDGRSVCTTSSGNRSNAIPGLPDRSYDWIEIDKAELNRLKRKILRGSGVLKEEADQVSNLINTSFEDMKASITCMTPAHYGLNILKKAFIATTRRGEKTKANYLRAQICKFEKEAKKERKLRLVQQAYD